MNVFKLKKKLYSLGGRVEEEEETQREDSSAGLTPAPRFQWLGAGHSLQMSHASGRDSTA